MDANVLLGLIFTILALIGGFLVASFSQAQLARLRFYLIAALLVVVIFVLIVSRPQPPLSIPLTNTSPQANTVVAATTSLNASTGTLVQFTSPTQYLVAASELYNAGKYGEAIVYYSLAIKMDRDFADAYRGLGNVYYDQGRHRDALKSYIRYLQLAGSNVDELVEQQVTLMKTNLLTCSEQAATPITAKFYNSTNRSLAIYWVDYECREQRYGTINPNSGLDIETFVTHQWLVRDLSSQDILDELTVTSTIHGLYIR
jgi:tetratricopeptide (TPR) repeat protein